MIAILVLWYNMTLSNDLQKALQLEENSAAFHPKRAEL